MPPETVLRILHWAILLLAVLVGGLVVLGAALQVHHDRQNRHRIACYQAWEHQLTEYLFKGGHERGPFPAVAPGDRWLFRNFLARYKSTLAGAEGELLRRLYFELGVHASIPGRLQSRHPRVRAQAALEVGLFRLETAGDALHPRDYLQRVLPLLDDPVPYVAHVAARALTHSQDLRYAAPVLAWVMREEIYQRERLLRVLEGFGPGLLPWMKDHLESPTQNPESWILYVLLVGSHRHRDSQPRLLWLLEIPHVDLRVSVLKSLIILADPAVYPRVLPFATSPAWEIRAQVARALGVLGGPSAVPELLPLMADRVYEVRRNAAQSLVDLGHAGASALRWIAEDPMADRFARDIARERLEWADERGHP